MKVSLITPPTVQLNTPYPAVPVLTRALRECGYNVSQHDFSLELALKVFTKDVLENAFDVLESKHSRDRLEESYIVEKEGYLATIGDVVGFLQGRKPEFARHIVSRRWLPELAYFNELVRIDAFNYEDEEEADGEETLNKAFGENGIQDRAKYLASLYMEDVAALINHTLDDDFQLSKYGEGLAVSLPSFNPLLEKLSSSKSTIIEYLLDELTDGMLAAEKPDFVGISMPFPGTVYGGFRIAKRICEKAPNVKIIIGGGYVNSELRDMEDARVFDYVDYISYDHGVAPLCSILDGKIKPSSGTMVTCSAKVRTREGMNEVAEEQIKPLLAPDYVGLDLGRYICMNDTLNPMQGLWGAHTWMKMQVTYGCPWHRCAFCDLSLDYIKDYREPSAKDVVDAMESLMAETGRNGFHFTDEALTPKFLKALCTEILERGINPVWWCNIRFEPAFDEDVVALMADSGCIAVTGGLECANDRLLKLMNKGISLAKARRVLSLLSEHGILVHAYLMYGFPTETLVEAQGAMEFVRGCFADGILNSAFWHRFALTAHSPMAESPDKYGIAIVKQKLKGPRFALNEIHYREKTAPDWEKIGQGLDMATYNCMIGRAESINVKEFVTDSRRL